jgi:hypothetical protein
MAAPRDRVEMCVAEDGERDLLFGRHGGCADERSMVIAASLGEARVATMEC